MLMVLDQKSLTIRLHNSVLKIYQDDKLIQHAAIKVLDMLVIYGNPMIEAGIFRALASANIPTIILANRGTQTPALLGQGLNSHLQARRLQYACADNPEQALELARWFLVHKFLSYHPLVTLLEQENFEYQPLFKQIQHALAQAHQTHTLNTLMGIEGNLSRLWFQTLAQSMPKQWRFKGRNRQPPRDPLNALLSLGYTLALGDIRQVISSYGFDPALGFLHQDYPARDSLALDVLEVYRSGVDLFALKMLDDLNPTDFRYSEKEGCRLVKAVRPRFYREWAVYRNNWLNPLGVITEKPSPRLFSPLRQQVGGTLQRLRQVMKELRNV